jgi:hypothetical protein
VERDASGSSDLHVTTSDAGLNNVLFLVSNPASTINFTFDDGTFDGQTITYHTDDSTQNVSFSDNVATVTSGNMYAACTSLSSLSFAWDAANSLWTLFF